MHKVVMVGEAFVGKTAIAQRYRLDSYTELGEPTIGAANFILPVELDEGKVVQLDLWDTAGQERYRSLTPIYFQNAEAAILVFDLTRKNTLESLTSFYDMIQQKCIPDIGIFLVGNKYDLKDAREVNQSDISALVEEIHAVDYVDTSAKENTGIDLLFRSIGAFIDAKAREQNMAELPHLEPNTEDSQKCSC